MIYSEVRERVIEGVIRRSIDPPPLDRIRMIFDASFPTVNSEVSEAFAASNDKRELLRVVETLTFTAGTAPLSTNTLKEYMADATLAVGTTRYGFRKYPDYVRSNDRRLGKWTSIGESLLATQPLNAGVLTGAATFSSIQTPAVPATEGATFVVAEDYASEFISVMVEYILGQQAATAAKSA